MIEYDLQPVCSVVTHVASLIGGNMSGTFPGCDTAVMAVLARIRGLRVIDGNHIRQPARPGGMAALAKISSQRMAGRLVSGVDAGMTTGTTVGGLLVREWCGER